MAVPPKILGSCARTEVPSSEGDVENAGRERIKKKNIYISVEKEEEKEEEVVVAAEEEEEEA